MCVISNQYRFVFQAVPKTGTTSIRSILAQYGAESYGTGRTPQHSRFIPEDCLDFFTFASVRCPYSRMVSLFYHCRNKMPRGRRKRVARSLTFGQWVKYAINHPEKCGLTKHIILQKDFLAPVRLDKVLKLESLAEDFQTLPFVNQVHKFPILNATRHPTAQHHWRRDIVLKILPRLMPDFEMFGYDPKAIL